MWEDSSSTKTLILTFHFVFKQDLKINNNFVENLSSVLFQSQYMIYIFPITNSCENHALVLKWYNLFRQQKTTTSLFTVHVKFYRVQIEHGYFPGIWISYHHTALFGPSSLKWFFKRVQINNCKNHRPWAYRH